MVASCRFWVLSAMNIFVVAWQMLLSIAAQYEWRSQIMVNCTSKLSGLSDITLSRFGMSHDEQLTA